MRTSLFRMAMLGICLKGLAAADAAPAQSFFDGGAAAFTDQQAARGQIVYTESCGRCRGCHLDDGQFGPPLKGTGFKAHWHDQSPEKLWTALFRRMPPADPSGLPARAYTNVEAYLLRENGESPGVAPLVMRGTPLTCSASIS